MSTPTPSIRFALFDMDGVLFEGDQFWLDLHRVYGTQERGLELYRRFGSSDYAHLARTVAGRLWRGLPARPYVELVRARRYQPGVAELFARLRALNVRTAIVSSGPWHLAARAQQDLRIDVVRANRLVVRDARLTGDVRIQVSDARKLAVGLALIRGWGGTPQEAMFVGDTDADAPLAAAVGIGVAYNTTSARLIRASKLHLSYGRLSELTRVLRHTRETDSPAPPGNDAA